MVVFDDFIRIPSFLFLKTYSNVFRLCFAGLGSRKFRSQIDWNGFTRCLTHPQVCSSLPSLGTTASHHVRSRWSSSVLSPARNSLSSPTRRRPVLRWFPLTGSQTLDFHFCWKGFGWPLRHSNRRWRVCLHLKITTLTRSVRFRHRCACGSALKPVSSEIPAPDESPASTRLPTTAELNLLTKGTSLHQSL